MHGNGAPMDSGMIVFLIAWVIAMAHIGIGKYVIERLKDRHRSTWISLGSPGIFIGGNAHNAFLLWRFITFSGHRALRDDGLNSICRADIALQLIFLPLFAASVYLLASHHP
jgi:hypothetical protein